jgi:hypothetical protein
MSLHKLFISLVVALAFCGSAIAQTNPPWQCDSCSAGLVVTAVTPPGTTNTFGANCPAFAQFQSPCAVTYHVTGPSVATPNGPLQYFLAFDITTAGIFDGCYGWLNLLNPSLLAIGSLPYPPPSPVLICANGPVVTDSSITSVLPLNTGAPYTVWIQALVNQPDGCGNVLTQAVSITIL